MQRVTLLVSAYVFLASLAAPALLFASEETDAAPPGETPAAAPEAGVEPTQPTLEPDPEEAGKVAGKDEGETSAPAPTAVEPQSAASEESTKSKKRGGSSGKGARAKAAAEIVVTMRDIAFHPRNIGIGVGDTVIWENEDPERHNALGENNSFETPVISEGETSRHSFNKAGKFPYFCSLHQGMDGTITVGSSSNGGSGGSGGGSGSGTGGTSTGSGTTGLGTSGSTSSLPSTGQDLVWLALIGAGLLTLGAAVRLLLARRPWI